MLATSLHCSIIVGTPQGRIKKLKKNQIQSENGTGILMKNVILKVDTRNEKRNQKEVNPLTVTVIRRMETTEIDHQNDHHMPDGGYSNLERDPPPLVLQSGIHLLPSVTHQRGSLRGTPLRPMACHPQAPGGLGRLDGLHHQGFQRALILPEERLHLIEIKANRGLMIG